MGYNKIMRKGSIKNYDIYYNKLIDYANLCNVRVYFADLKGTEDELDMGEYLWLSRQINLNNKLTQKETLAVLLHELGHFMDHKLNPRSKSTEQAYNKLAEDKLLTRRQKELIVKCEKTAWEMGRGLASKLGIPLGDWFDLEMMTGLSGYHSLKFK